MEVNAYAKAEEKGHKHFSLNLEHQQKNAYRMYFNQGLDITAHHFGKDVKDL